jgi:PAS domain S-box-containing protein
MSIMVPIAPELRRWLAERLKKRLANRLAPDVLETEMVRKDGSRYTALVAPATIHDQGGKVSGLFGVMIDITERKKAEEELAEHQRQLKEKIEERTAELTATNKKLKKEIIERNQAEELLQKERGVFSCILQKAPFGVALIDGSGRCLYTNPEFTSITGYTLQDVATEKDWLNRAFPDQHYRRQVVGTWKRDFAQREIDKIFTVTCKDGQAKEIEFRPTVIDDNKVLVALSGITQRKQAEEALQESEENYRSIFDAANDAIFVHDAETGQIIDVNKKMCELYGYSVEEARQVDVEALSVGTPPYTQKDVLRRIKKAASGEPQLFEWMAKDRSGRLFWVEVNLKLAVIGEKKRLLAIVRDINDRKRTEGQLRESERRFRELADLLPQSVFEIDIDGNLTFANRNAFSSLGYTEDDLAKGLNALQVIAPEDRERARENGRQILSGEDLGGNKYNAVRKDGSTFPAVVYSSPIIHGKKAVGLRGILVDITELKHLERQLLWSQKMETVGRLAGGVAHDFNNMLTTIAGYAELGTMKLHPNDPLQGDLQEVLKASQRAAKLTRQLLTFSRRQITEPRVINLNDVLLSMDKMLRRLIGADIELVTLPAEGLGRVKVDPSQLEQVILNLCVNARDAMPNGGKLTLETSNITLDDKFTRDHDGLIPGEYVGLSVGDTGVGMAEEVKPHLFEPFFTTKEIGKGTGLGLATCYGIVRQGGGAISFSTELGKGTTFSVYLPLVGEEAEALPTRDDSGYLPRGTETILLVEDEPAVRNMTRRLLYEQGYTIIEGANGEEALRMTKKHKNDEIHLLLTDVVMPQMGGIELAESLKDERPGIKMFFFSGYTDDTIVRLSLLGPDVAFLQKPFSPGDLARKIREVLDR